MIEKEIAGKSRVFEFGTYTFKLIAEYTGVVNVKDVFTRLTNNDLPFMMVIFYACAVHGCKKKKVDPDFNESDVYDWVDEIGIGELEIILSELIKAYTLKNQTAPATGQIETTNQ